MSVLGPRNRPASSAVLCCSCCWVVFISSIIKKKLLNFKFKEIISLFIEVLEDWKFYEFNYIRINV